MIRMLPARSEARRLASQALVTAESSHFRLFETELRRP
jgi:hypothetical protein